MWRKGGISLARAASRRQSDLARAPFWTCVVLYGCHCAYSYRVLREKWIPLFCMKGSDIFPPPRGI